MTSGFERDIDTVTAALREMQRKLDDLQRLEESIAKFQPPSSEVDVEIVLPDDAATEDSAEALLQWCRHTAHLLERFFHPSLGRLFFKEAITRFEKGSPHELTVTVRWLRSTTHQIVRDTVEHGNRLVSEGLGRHRHRAALPPGSNVPLSKLSVRPSKHTEPQFRFVDNWAVFGPADVGASIFVIHGHDTRARDTLEVALSRRFRVRVVVMYSQTVPTIPLPEKFERCARECNLAIALLTPDDVGSAVGTDLGGARVRQNVLVELGWFWGRCGLHNLLLVSPGKLDLPSDLAGLQIVRYDTSVEEAMPAIDSFMAFHGISTRKSKAQGKNGGSYRRPNRRLQPSTAVTE